MTDKGLLDSRFVMILSFLGLFILFVTFLPSNFFALSETYAQKTYPDYFSQEDIQQIKHFENGTITRPAWGFSNHITLDFNPDANFKFKVRWYNNIAGDRLQVYHITWEFWIFETTDQLEITDENFKQITKERLEAYWQPDYNSTIFYPCQCDHITVKMWFTDTNSSRNNITQAWNDGSLDVGMGFGFEDYETKLNAWDIVGRLMTFQPIDPEMTGVGGTMMGFLISFPIWCAIAYLIYRLILLAIPFVG